MQITRRTAIAGLTAMSFGKPALAAPQPVTYLFPAPSFLPAFIPFHVARKRGYFEANNLAVTSQTAKGGVDVAKQVGAGNADFGNALGDTPIIVRPNGIPVRAVALLGQHSLFQIAARKEANIKSIADLRGKKVGVTSYQEAGYFALLAVLSANGLKRSDLEIEAVGPAGMTQLMIAKALDANMTVIEWADAIESAGVALDYFRIDKFFPAMPQAILASDTTIKERPETIATFVKTQLQAVRDCIDDPAKAARDFVSIVPQYSGKEVMVERVLRRYVTDVYRTDPPSALGKLDAERYKIVQSFYLENKIIDKPSPVETLFTNQFVT
ncbi:MAG TPA: ABC transporter substrate-binding protein [Xanthobacteraceae bacterium]|nr:ABC transporter substrate-binding protein [Xanthobacteraceae bacterium]